VGYQIGQKVYRLVFDDGDLAGLEVRTRSLPLGALLDIAKLAGLAGKQFDVADLGEVEKLFSLFADALLSWNVEDEAGAAVPATPEGLRLLDFGTVIQLISEWIEAVAGVAVPLPKTSSGGQPSLEASMPMEPLSPSPAI